jgi:Rod binding domain-containing protein
MNMPVGSMPLLALASASETTPPHATGATVEPSPQKQTAAGALTPRAAREPVVAAALPKSLTASQSRRQACRRHRHL